MLSILAAAALASALPPRPIRDFGDWTVGCDNGRKCQAVSLVPESGGGEELPFATLVVERGAGDGDLPKVAVEPALDELPPAASLLVDGQRTAVRLDDEGLLRDGADALPLLRQLSPAGSARLLDSSGKPVARIALSGAAAALRWMDEQQLRARSGSAILAMGTGLGPQSTPILPSIQAAASSAKAPRAITAAEVAAARKPHDCDPPADSAPELHRLDPATTLAILPCMLHAYQSSSVVVIAADHGAWSPAPLEQRFASTEPDPSPHWMTEPQFDRATRSLWTTYKGRGLNDCGGTEVYVWDGTAFRLAYMARMDRCQGSRARITLWRTANQPEP
jgi:hypothetical protein